MGFLNPLFLAAAAAVAVPVLVHLLHMRSGKRRAFPALRYLRRTEREHARRIRIRQLLLLILRMTAVFLLVLAGARLFLRGGGDEHEPTAVAIVLDNSLSSGVVVGEERMLDVLKRTALGGLESATAEDRIWVLRAGEPWETSVPGSPADARRRIQETEPRGAAPSLPRTVARARSLVSSAGLPAAEVHLLSDLQATAFPDSGGTTSGPEGAEAPVLVLDPPGRAPPNRFVAEVEVGGGLPPLLNQTTQVSARVERNGGTDQGDDTVRVRLILDGRMTAAADAPLGATVVLRAGPFALTEVRGAVEIDPDALRTDDRRYFSFRVRPPPRVRSLGQPGLFMDEALSVLVDAGRVRRAADEEADVMIVAGGAQPDDGRDRVPAVVLPPDDPVLLPSTNRWLREAGSPWRLEADLASGEASLEPSDLPVTLDGVRVQRAYGLVPAGDEAGGVVRARRSTGEPWMVSTETAEGRPLLILGSPLLPGATTLPVSPDMLPLVEWMVSGWPPTFRTAAASVTGEPLPLPARATAVRTPDGTLHRVDGRQPFHATGSPGVYQVLDGDSVTTSLAVNPPEGESLLRRLELATVLRRIPAPVRTVSDPDEWASRTFLQRRGREPWRLLLVTALLLLLGEGLLAAGGRGHRTPERPRPRGVAKATGSERANVS